MREVIAICRSTKRSRDRTARVLDRYFWRIGDRTWRGRATNACLDRVARELRRKAARNTAIVIHEIRSSHESRRPLIRIGTKSAFSEDGLVPVASHPADYRSMSSRIGAEQSGLAAVRIAALFHDLGKATNLFQKKLRCALNGDEPKGDAVRHELFSAAVWDVLFGRTKDGDLASALQETVPERIDAACREVRDWVTGIHHNPQADMGFGFLLREGSLTHTIGMLILTHHRLPSGASDHVTLTGSRHTRSDFALARHTDLAIASGVPFWHEEWWLSCLQREAQQIIPEAVPSCADIALRASLMFADHVGSALKSCSDKMPEHLANTKRDEVSGKSYPADSLSTHVKRVYKRARAAFDLTHRLRERFPALDDSALPEDLLSASTSVDPRFAWQGEAARAARAMCEKREGGFFACVLAGTGTGKTRGAPAILANAAMGDFRPERRYLRMSLGLGLRVLATQSAREYVEDLGFRDEDVSVLVGQPPLRFPDEDVRAAEGSESHLQLPEWLNVENPGPRIPEPGSAAEETWLRGLSLDTDRSLPAFLEVILAHAGKKKESGRRLLSAPIMVGTIDHLMDVAAPANSRFLLQSLRLLTSDLILDEIDQYDGEDLAAIGRLIYQAGAAGRRVIIMSATLTSDIAEVFHKAYSSGWKDYAQAHELSSHVHLLLCSDASGSVITNVVGGGIQDLLKRCQEAILCGIHAAKPLRRAEILPICGHWKELTEQVDQSCSRLHDLNAVEIDGFRVSVGMVRMTRISHVTALAAQIRSGVVEGRLRVLACLHSQFPRLHRAYIETCLKLALTRKGANPESGLRSLCQAQCVFDKAVSAGVHDIEIVVITSPVIETGNDLDFDYAIIDPISTRSIIQTAGRVRRHRPVTDKNSNVLILGRSPIAMQGGRLARPGVETRPATETLVPYESSLEQFDGRKFSELKGGVDFSVISAAPIFSDYGSFPLRDAEANLRARMLSIEADAPLGRYLTRSNARWNSQFMRTRKFRRSEAGEVLYQMIGETIHGAEWFVDVDPGTSHSRLSHASSGNLHLAEVPACALFENITTSAWDLLSGGARELDSEEISTLLQARVPRYVDDINPEMTYTEFTGFTRGKPEDLFEAFGKSEKFE